MTIDKDFRSRRAKDIQDSIRQILLRDWDPINVYPNQNCSDEYDSYIAPIYRILVGNRSEEDIISALSLAEAELMGKTCAALEQFRSIARKLLELNSLVIGADN